jgi:DNA processing protein
MSETLSLNTKAILLLTAPLIVGRGKSKEPADLLTPGEYTKLALYLQETGRQPADLLVSDTDQLFGDCHRILDQDRLRRLLDRGFLLSQAVERWQTRTIWVISRADDAYPQTLKARLKKDSPVVLYGCGDREILNSGGLAVVGSRNVNDSLIEYTQEIGRLAAKARQTVVSGAARGIDRAAMSGALEAGGKVTGVLADSLEQTAMTREHRNLLLEGQLVLISPYDPNAGFNAGHAMQRNKVIYALADAALVVNADINKGGTWAGAIEQLEKLHLGPVYVRSTGETSRGLDALKNKGAMPWPNPADANDLDAVFQPDTPKVPSPPTQSNLPFDA